MGNGACPNHVEGLIETAGSTQSICERSESTSVGIPNGAQDLAELIDVECQRSPYR